MSNLACGIVICNWANNLWFNSFCAKLASKFSIHHWAFDLHFEFQKVCKLIMVCFIKLQGLFHLHSQKRKYTIGKCKINEDNALTQFLAIQMREACHLFLVATLHFWSNLLNFTLQLTMLFLAANAENVPCTECIWDGTSKVCSKGKMFPIVACFWLCIPLICSNLKHPFHTTCLKNTCCTGNPFIPQKIPLQSTPIDCRNSHTQNHTMQAFQWKQKTHHAC